MVPMVILAVVIAADLPLTPRIKTDQIGKLSGKCIVNKGANTVKDSLIMNSRLRVLHLWASVSSLLKPRGLRSTFF